MKPGREMDVLIAEKVMGWKRIEGSAVLDLESPGWTEEERLRRHWHMRVVWYCGDERKACDECGTMPQFSTSIEHAWMVMDKCREITFIQRDGRSWRVFISVDGDNDYAASQSAPHAICLAALAVKGVRSDDLE